MKRWKTAAHKHQHQFKQTQIKTSGNQAESSKIRNKPQNQGENLNSEMEIRISYKERNPIAASVRGEEEMPYGKRRGSNLQWICSAEQATAPPSLPLPLSLSSDAAIPTFAGVSTLPSSTLLLVTLSLTTIIKPVLTDLLFTSLTFTFLLSSFTPTLLISSFLINWLEGRNNPYIMKLTSFIFLSGK